MEAGFRLITADEYFDEVCRQETNDYNKPISMWVRTKGIDFSDYKQNTKCHHSGPSESAMSDVTLTSSVVDIYATPSRNRNAATADSKTDTGPYVAEGFPAVNIYATEYNKAIGLSNFRDIGCKDTKHAWSGSNNAQFTDATSGTDTSADLFGRDRPPGLDNTPTRERSVAPGNSGRFNPTHNTNSSTGSGEWNYSYGIYNTDTNTSVGGGNHMITNTDTADCKTLPVTGHLSMLSQSGMIQNMSSPGQVPYTTDSEENCMSSSMGASLDRNIYSGSSSCVM